MPSFSPWSKIDSEQNTIPFGDVEDKVKGFYIAKKKTKREGMFVMTKEGESKVGEEKSEGLTISKPEDQIYQKLNLCDHLRELYEADEEDKESLIEKKKD